MTNFTLIQTGTEVQNILNDVANKAPIDSPIFTGDPKSVTPTIGDNDTSIATTEFVNQNAVIKTGDTGSAKIPSGTTEQRPLSPIDGMIRYNSTTGSFEGYSNGNWSPIAGGQMLGTATTKAIAYNSLLIQENIIIPENIGAYSAGDVEIAIGYEVEIPSSSEWVII